MTELKFTDQEMQLLQMAIGELPHKLAVPLIQSINRQIVGQKKDQATSDEADAKVSP